MNNKYTLETHWSFLLYTEQFKYSLTGSYDIVLNTSNSEPLTDSVNNISTEPAAKISDQDTFLAGK